MPELPEVETIRREPRPRGRRQADQDGARSAAPARSAARPKKQFIAQLEGAKITGVDRRGKYLLLKLDTGECWSSTCGMSGQLLRAQARTRRPSTPTCVITFTQGGQLRFVDPRTFGELFVTAPDELTEEVPELADARLRPVDEPMSVGQTFGQLLLEPHDEAQGRS